jgi:hypothetical protein
MVTLPSPRPPSLKILSSGTVMVTGSGPQLKVTTPPPATAAATALAVQLVALPVPTTVVGDETSAASPALGTAQWPLGLPLGPGGIWAASIPPPAPEPPPHPLAKGKSQTTTATMNQDVFRMMSLSADSTFRQSSHERGAGQRRGQCIGRSPPIIEWKG